MALATTCCLNNNLNPPPLPPKSHSLSPTTTTNQLVALSGNNEGSWRKRCVVGVAGVVMALQMGDWVVGETAAMEMGDAIVDVEYSRSAETTMRWSDELRMCPQWRLNSLETIVPENLPRPTGRRRWEAVRLPKTAPQLRATHTSSPPSRCFSM